MKFKINTQDIQSYPTCKLKETLGWADIEGRVGLVLKEDTNRLNVVWFGKTQPRWYSKEFVTITGVVTPK